MLGLQYMRPLLVPPVCRLPSYPSTCPGDMRADRARPARETGARRERVQKLFNIHESPGFQAQWSSVAAPSCWWQYCLEVVASRPPSPARPFRGWLNICTVDGKRKRENDTLISHQAPLLYSVLPRLFHHILNLPTHFASKAQSLMAGNIPLVFSLSCHQFKFNFLFFCTETEAILYNYIF